MTMKLITDLKTPFNVRVWGLGFGYEDFLATTRTESATLSVRVVAKNRSFMVY